MEEATLPVGLERHEGVLCFAGKQLSALAESYGTPLYVYAEEVLARHADAWHEGMQTCFGEQAEVAYAVKANDRLRVLQTLAEMGCGCDIVSEGEMLRALAAGVPAERIVFSGVGKGERELRAALRQGVRRINVESESELQRLSEIAQHEGQTASVSLRLTPDIAAGGHDKISTGRKQDKFGIAPEQALALWRRPWKGIAFDGIAVHCGSQICSLEPFEKTFRFLAEWASTMQTLSLPLERIDLGGGIGIDQYGTPTPSPLLYARAAKRLLAPVLESASNKKTRILCEPGRSIAAAAGVLLARVIDVKRSAKKICLIVDAGMNDFLRSALYDAQHPILPVLDNFDAKNNTKPSTIKPPVKTWVVGPVCESSDTFGEHDGLAHLARGDLLALCLAGAYGSVMASSYNARPRAAELFIEHDGDTLLLREREDIQAVVAEEKERIKTQKQRKNHQHRP